MKPVHFPIVLTTMTHPNQWTVKKEYISKRRFDKLIKGVTLASVCIFLLVLLHRSVICSSNLSLESNLTRKSFSQSLFFYFKVVNI